MRALHREGLTAFWLLIACCAAPPTAAAGGIAFLPPDGCLPADGGPPFWIHVFGGSEQAPDAIPAISASAGRIDGLEALGEGLVRFRFHPPRLEQAQSLKFAGPQGAGAAEMPACPHPVGLIEVQADPDQLMAGQGQKSFLRIQVQDTQGRPLAGQPLELSTNVGRIETWEDLGQGRYRAVYVPPDDPHPQVAIIMVANPASARLDRVAVARVVIPITARVELPGKTAPGTRMQMIVAGRRFGPVQADRKGRFSLPILVPPGFGTAEATSIDRVGNRKTRRIPLFLPETNQLGLWAYPRTLSADGRSRSRLLVTLMDPFGRLRDLNPGEKATGLRIHAARGKLAGLKHLQTGLYETYYTSPVSIGEGRDRIEVRFPGGGSQSRASVELELLAGPAARLELQVPELLAADGRTEGPIELRVFDGRGNPVGREVVALSADEGTIRGLREVAPGVHQAKLVAGPDPATWNSEVRASVTDRKGTRSARLMVTAGSLHALDGGGFELEAVLADELGLPVAGGTVRFQAAGRQTEAASDSFGRVRFRVEPQGPTGPRSCRLQVVGTILERLVYWIEIGGRVHLLPIRLDEALPPASPLTAVARVRLHPPAPIRISIWADPVDSDGDARQIRIRVVDSSGSPLRGLGLQLSCSAGRLGRVREAAAGEYRADWHADSAGWSRALVSVVDPGSQVGALVHLVEGQASP